MFRPTLNTEDRLLVEVGWEVCWQLGGIYTVLRSKAPEMVKQWGSRYCMVGPYNQATASVEFEPLPNKGYFGRACELLQQQGIKAYYGKWLITGEPQVLLIDFFQNLDRFNGYKYYLWKDHGIETRDEQEVNDVVLFGYLVVDFFEALRKVIEKNDPEIAAESGVRVPAKTPVLGHFHEWMAGVPIPVMQKRNLPVATVFTTHATILGRYLAADDPNFYNRLPWIDPYRAAHERGIYPRFAIERAAAQSATCFTTISEITGSEAEHILGRKPDVLVPNGLNIQRFSAIHEFQNMHVQNKQKIHEFVMGHFFPSYNFDLDNTLYIFTAGRYEYRNKGIDLFIEGLARLNWRLKCENSKVTVVAFIVTRAPTNGINVDVLKNIMMYNEIRTVCNQIARQVGHKLLTVTSHGHSPKIEDLLSSYDQLRLKRLQFAWKKTQGWPSIVTHNMVYDASDAVLKQLRACKLFNQPDNPVKVIYHPEFLTATSPIIGLDYDQFVRGCHLGVFPSYYEPWGYTPEECTAFGIPNITSDLTGFGSYVKQHIEENDENGMFVIERRYKSFHESADQLAEAMHRVLTMNMRERIELRNRVESQSQRFDWRELIIGYQEAQELALRRTLRLGPPETDRET